MFLVLFLLGGLIFLNVYHVLDGRVFNTTFSFSLQDFDPVLALLQELPSEGPDSSYFRERVRKRMDQLDVINEQLSKQVSAPSYLNSILQQFEELGV